MIIFAYIIAAVQAYLIGGINGAIITSKRLYKRDIREEGSHNPGLTNFHRVFGVRGVLLVILVDVAKTLMPVLIGGWVFRAFGFSEFSGKIFAGLFVMLGHAFPIYYEFKGGKTVLAVGVLLCSLDWRIAVVGWGIFLAVLAITRFVSLGAILGVWGFPIAIAIFRLGTVQDFVIAVLCSIFLAIRHRENIKRLIRGEESKLRFKKG